MKRILPALLTLSFFTVAQAQKLKQTGGKEHEIKIKIKDYSGEKLFLVNYYGDKEYVKDSASRDNKGWFVFSGQEPIACGIYSAVNKERTTKFFEFMVNTNEQFFSLETDSISPVAKMKIKGSEENSHFYEYQNFINDKGFARYQAMNNYQKAKGKNSDSAEIFKTQIDQLDKDISAFREAFIEKYPNSLTARVFKAMNEVKVPDAPKNADGTTDSTFAFKYYKAHFWDHVDFTEDCLLRTPIFHKKLERYIKDLTFQIPDSINATADDMVARIRHLPEMYHYVVWWITMDYERSQYMCMDAVPVHMWKNYYVYPEAFWVDSADMIRIRDREKVLSKLICGITAPNLVMKDSAHIPHELHKTKAKYTVVLFWDPDCSHCLKELPKIKKMYDEIKGMGVEIYAVGVEQDYEKWKEYIRKNNLEWINVIDIYNTTNFRHLYDINSTPVIYILDKDKKIIAKKMGSEQLEDILRNELKLPAKDRKKDDKKPGHTP